MPEPRDTPTPDPEPGPIWTPTPADEQTNEPGPTVGRIVHFVAQDGAHKAAIIIDVNEGGGGAPVTADLQVAYFTGWRVHGAVPYQAAAEPDVENTWHWPERA